MSKRIQVVLPDKVAKEVDEIIREEGHENVSEFYRHLTQEYIFRKQYGLVKAAGGVEGTDGLGTFRQIADVTSVG